MKDTMCGYHGDRGEAIIACLYDDGDAVAQAEFDAHLDTCVACREELNELRGVRERLSTWTPPALRTPDEQQAPARSLAVANGSGLIAGQQSHQPSAIGHDRRTASRAATTAMTAMAAMPAWAQVAAAMLFVGIAGAIANVSVHYDASGITVRTGWMNQTPTSATRRPSDAASIGGRVAGVSMATSADLAALERRLRSEFRPVNGVPGASAPAAVAFTHTSAASLDTDALRRVRALIDQSIEASEKRQQRELALQVGQLINDVNALRRADLVRIDRTLGVLRADTSAEVAKNRQALQQLNYIVSVSQKQEP